MKKVEKSACTHVAHCLNNVNQMNDKRNEKPKNGMGFTGVKMERRLYLAAKRQAKSRHQSYSEYVRQLIVRDVESIPAR